jgi:hypothetical protein
MKLHQVGDFDVAGTIVEDHGEVNDLVREQAGLDNLFAANVSSSDVLLGRPAPFMIFRRMEASGVTSVREVVNVGDTPLDLQAGSNAGVRGVVGVLTGWRGKGASASRTACTYSGQRGGYPGMAGAGIWAVVASPATGSSCRRRRATVRRRGRQSGCARRSPDSLRRSRDSACGRGRR